MQKTILILLLSTLLHPLVAQKSFTYQSEKLEVLGQLHLAAGVQHDLPVSTNDHAWVQVFKKYFNPGSFESFRSFFDSKDWPDITSEQFDAWQQTLHSDKLYLQHVLHLKDKRGQQFLVFLYVMENAQYSIYQSKAMKYLRGQWMHRGLDEETMTLLLEQIGSMDPAFLQQQNETEILRVEDVPGQSLRSYREKFDRSGLFSSIQPVLEVKGISAEDIQYARNLFLEGNDKGMMEYLIQISSIEDTVLMKAVNDACGFTLYNFFQQKHGN